MEVAKQGSLSCSCLFVSQGLGAGQPGGPPQQYAPQQQGSQLQGPQSGVPQPLYAGQSQGFPPPYGQQPQGQGYPQGPPPQQQGQGYMPQPGQGYPQYSQQQVQPQTQGQYAPGHYAPAGQYGPPGQSPPGQYAGQPQYPPQFPQGGVAGQFGSQQFAPPPQQVTESFTLSLWASKLHKPGVFAQSNPFFVLYAESGATTTVRVDLGKHMPPQGMVPILKSEVVQNNLSPSFHSQAVAASGAMDSKLVIELLDWDKNGGHKVMGMCETSFRALQAAVGREVQLIPPHGAQYNAGALVVRGCSPLPPGQIVPGLVSIFLPPNAQQQGPIAVASQPGFVPFKFPDAREKEPMLLLDTTGSMNEATSAVDPTPRKETVAKIIGFLVERMQEEDSQAHKEKGGGGLMTITFAGGSAEELDDLNPQNLAAKWAKIKWQGKTFIVPGWKKLQKVYQHEFRWRKAADKPYLLCLIITDGEAEDLHEFERLLSADHNSYVVIAVVGYGPHYQACMESFERVAAKNARVSVVSLQADTPPQIIAGSLLRYLA
jgi:hypothetical protein